MKLASISATAICLPKPAAGGIPLIEIRTDDGLTGWGEAHASWCPDAVCHIVRDLLAPVLKNRVFRGERGEIESLWNRLYGLTRNDGQTGGFMLEAIAAVDVALWDIAGRAHNQPIRQLAGSAAGIAEVGAFASLPGANAASLAGAVHSMQDAGIDRFELTHGGSEEELIAALDLVQGALKDDAKAAVDARWRLHTGWDLRFERQIDQRGPQWLANPLPPEDPFAHGQLAKAMCTPLALGESYHSHFEVAPFFHELAVGALQPDLGRCGLTEALRMAEMAKAHNIPVIVRVGESVGPQLAAALQFAAMGEGRRVEYRAERLKTANSALAEPIELRRGKYQVPGGPGLGIRIEEAEIHLMETEAA